MNTADFEALRQIIREEIESVLRLVMREELTAGLAQPLYPLSLPVPSLEEFLTSFAHPYSLSERELQQAESLMSP